MQSVFCVKSSFSRSEMHGTGTVVTAIKCTLEIHFHYGNNIHIYSILQCTVPVPYIVKDYIYITFHAPYLNASRKKIISFQSNNILYIGTVPVP